MRELATRASLILALFVSTGCRNNSSLRVRSASTLGFSTTETQLPYSLLHNLTPSGSLTVCLGAPDGADEAKLKRTLEPLVRETIQGWNRLLATHPSWPHKSDLQIAFEYRPQCQSYTTPPKKEDWAKLKIDQFQTAAAFAERVCQPDEIKNDDSLCRSTSSVEWHAIWLSPETISADDFFVEYGHMLGIGNILERSGPKESDNRSPRIARENLRSQQERSLKAAFTYINSGRIECGEGYVPLTDVRKYGLRSLYCLPTSTRP